MERSHGPVSGSCSGNGRFDRMFQENGPLYPEQGQWTRRYTKGQMMVIAITERNRYQNIYIPASSGL